MARRTTDVTITEEGRDKGRTYRLTEMPASRAEKWAMRAFLALAGSGVDIPEGVRDAGVAGLAAIGFSALARIQFPAAEALMDEMFECVSFVPDASRPAVVRPLIESDIDEVVTRVRLRAEVFALHTGFTLADGWSVLTLASAAPGSTPRTSPGP